MLELCDAALIIGDAALVLDPADLPFRVLDLGPEWTRNDRASDGIRRLGRAGRACPRRIRHRSSPPSDSACEHIDDIAREEHPKLGISEALAREYLTRNIVFELGEKEYAGLNLFLQYASELENPAETRKVTA